MNILGSSPYQDLLQVQNRVREVTSSGPLLEFVVYAYQEAPKLNVRWDLVVAQSILETGWGGSSAFLNDNNTAGIKWGPYGSGPTPYRHYNTLREGTRDHIALLAVYAGLWVPDMPDPSRNSRLRGIATTLEGLSGVWAEGNEYHFNVTRIGNRLFGWN